ncbi:hypothetical protein K435DRAFT_525164 [Dendrothele bispora CBS 962.96]|uniref:Uncharacterized protein n=1 Tax=Dendrothele bispora (strain CBS 962.96) TaxID=1314807 RepID=A0A4S8KUE9_DENBC|nr:hypothetical protein K435DRAFT_525164 [Dendrothele bispora CBS 962.96]
MAMFQAIEYNSTIAINTTGLPDFTNSLGNAITGSSSLLTIRSLENFINVTGLANNGLGAIYNIPVTAQDVTTVDARALNVSSTYFNVECGTIPGVVNSNSTSNTFRYNFLDTDLDTDLPDLSRNMITVNSAPWGMVDNATALWPVSLLVLSTVPVLDSSNVVAETVLVDPPTEYQSLNGEPRTVSSVSALACNLTLEFVDVTINPRTFGLEEFSALSAKNKTTSSMKRFPTTVRSSMDNLNTSDALVQTWPILTEIAVSPLNDFYNEQVTENCKTDDCTGIRLSVTDQFIMESFDLFPDRIMSNEVTRSHIFLHDLENFLSRMTAISIWSQAWGEDQKFVFRENQEFGDFSGNIAVTYKQGWMTATTIHRLLTLDLKQLYGAFALSIFLLALAAPAILDNNSLQIDSVGILQMVWLLQEHQGLQDRIGNVENPTTEKLREAGQSTNVCFGKHHHPTLPKVSF